jgi:hypothetical protein
MGRGHAGCDELGIDRTGAVLTGRSVIAAQGLSGFPGLLRRLAEGGRNKLARAGMQLRSLVLPGIFDRSAGTLGVHYASGSWVDIPRIPSVEDQVEADRGLWASVCAQAGVDLDSEETSLHPLEANMLSWARLDAQRRVNDQITPLAKFKLTLARARGGEKAALASAQLDDLYDEAVSEAVMEYVARIRLPEEASERTVQMRLQEMREERRLSLRAFKQTGRGDVRVNWIGGRWPQAATQAPTREPSNGYPVPESLRDRVDSEAPTLVQEAVSAPVPQSASTPEPVAATATAERPAEAELVDRIFAEEREAHSPVRTKTKPRKKVESEPVAKEIESEKIDELAVTLSALNQTTGFRYEIDYLSGKRASARKLGQGAIAQLDAAKALNALAANDATDAAALKAALDKFVVSCEESTGITAQNYGKLYQIVKSDPARFVNALKTLQSDSPLGDRVEAFQEALGTVTDKQNKEVAPLRPIQSVQFATYLLAAQGADVPLYASALYNTAVERLGGSKLRQGASPREALAFATDTAAKVRSALAERGANLDNSQILGLFYWALSDKGKKYAAALVANRDHDPQRFAKDVIALRAAGLAPQPKPQGDAQQAAA